MVAMLGVYLAQSCHNLVPIHP
uniref:Uncharacterized protein n=1 Tax=Anguilla anguilla TaxID=7936 RepID=A0A0E9Q2D4_ANGAN